MSRQNVEIVRRCFERAREDPAALWEIIDDDARWEVGPHDIADGPSSYRGPAGVEEFFRRWVGTFEDWDYDLDEVIDAGDSVVLHTRQWGRGKGSGVPVNDEFWQVWTFRDGKIVHRTRHEDRDEALEAVGLRG